MTRIELLAPARGLETGLAAINCGADAVYIGASKFGARRAAGNPLADIAQLAAYAHKYWARVYAVVNTLLYDDEIDQAVELTHQLYEVGVDALIIQDVGLLECDLPPLPLFASTQMHNHTPERVAFLEKIGFQRAILARELSLDQIASIRGATGIALEAFIHGALCVSYSGQCYLSYAFGGRSGNRGDCAQPCRKVYSLMDSAGNALVRDRHLLSIKDLNLSRQLADLLKAGITSFKIEGRLKNKEYVSNVVGYYRRQLDVLLSHVNMQPSSSGRVQLDYEPDIGKTFNRGYTTYFLNGRDPKLTSWDTPKHVGEFLGEVIEMHGDRFTLGSPIPLSTGDGLTFFTHQGILAGTQLNGYVADSHAGRVQITPASMENIYQGQKIYRNYDRCWMSRLHKSKPCREIGVDMDFSETETGFRLTVIDEDRNQGQAFLSCEKIPAQKAEQADRNLQRQLAKVRGSGFYLSGLRINTHQSYHLSLGTINALRREVLEELVKVRARNRDIWSDNIIPNNEPFPVSSLTFEGNVLNRKAEAFYGRHGVTQIRPAAESGIDLKGKRVMTTKFCLKYHMQACPRENSHRTVLAEPIFLNDDEGHRLRLTFNCRDCEMNIYLEG